MEQINFMSIVLYRNSQSELYTHPDLQSPGINKQHSDNARST